MALAESDRRPRMRRRTPTVPAPSPATRRPPGRPRPSGGGPPAAGSAGAAWTVALVAVLAAWLVPRPTAGQGIEDQISTLGAENGRLYAHPVSSGLGAGVNSGWFHTASGLGPLGVEIGVRAVGGFVPEGDRTFQPVLPDQITVDELGGQVFTDPYGSGVGLSTPTAVGEGSGIVVPPEGEFRQALLDAGVDPGDFALVFPEGFDLPAVPMGTLQLNVGVANGVDVVGRMLPRIDVNADVGTVQSLGGGLKLSVTDWIDAPTFVDVAVTGGLQGYDVGEYLSGTSRHAGLLASKTLSGLTLFAGGGLESSDVDVTYTIVNPALPNGESQVTFEDEGENGGRFTTGFSLDVFVLQLTADYTLATYETVSAGLGVRF